MIFLSSDGAKIQGSVHLRVTGTVQNMAKQLFLLIHIVNTQISLTWRLSMIVAEWLWKFPAFWAKDEDSYYIGISSILPSFPNSTAKINMYVRWVFVLRIEMFVQWMNEILKIGKNWG